MQFRDSKFKYLQIEVNQSEVSICFVDMEYQIWARPQMRLCLHHART